jgi:hypothetical protein
MSYFSMDLSLETVGGDEANFPTIVFSGSGIRAVLTHQGIRLSNGNEIRKAQVVFRDKAHPPEFDRTSSLHKQDEPLVGAIVYSEGCAASPDGVIEETAESCQVWFFLDRTILLALFDNLDKLHEFSVHFAVRGFEKDNSTRGYFDQCRWNLKDENHTLPISDFTYQINCKSQKESNAEREPKAFATLRRLFSQQKGERL